MMSILMKLRMVCNHPDIFEPRVIESPFQMHAVRLPAPAQVLRIRKRFGRRFQGRDPLLALELDIGGEFGLADREVATGDAAVPGLLPSRYTAQRAHKLGAPKKLLIETLRSVDFGGDPGASRRFQTFDDSRLSAAAKAQLENERRRLSSELAVEVADRARTFAGRQSTGPFDRAPVYGVDLRRIVTISKTGIAGANSEAFTAQWFRQNPKMEQRRGPWANGDVLADMVPLLSERVAMCEPIISRFAFITPKAVAPPLMLDATGSCNGAVLGNTLQEVRNEQRCKDLLSRAMRSPRVDSLYSSAVLHPSAVRLTLSFPDKMLVQYDCGKLQLLAKMLREKKAQGHRVLIFTQMTKMLDILEVFLNIHGHVYFRLDGSTKVDARQRMMEKFNRDTRIFAFILSTRSGGLGINLTGADTVIFYDSDWNPSMDAQAQDRAHRIGQTRDVHIYRLVSEHTIEENILSKANQKRELNKLSVEDGNFTVSSFLSTGGNISDLLGVEDKTGSLTVPVAAAAANGDGANGKAPSLKEIEAAMASVEDESDKLAMKRAQKEAAEDMVEFNENAAPLSEKGVGEDKKDADVDDSKTPASGHQSRSHSPAHSVASKATSAAPPEELTQEQFQSIEKILKPVERYAVGFRTHWFPVINMLGAYRQLEEMERTQEEMWEMDRLEEEQMLLEDEAEEEVIVAIDTIDGRRFDISHYIAARSAIFSTKVLKLLTASAWETYIDFSGRRYYWNTETRESTWIKPKIVDMLQESREVKRHKWSRLPRSVVIRILGMAESPLERLQWALVNKHWYSASRSGELYLWVDSVIDAGHRDACARCTKKQESGRPKAAFNNEWMTIGTLVEALYADGEVWYPGVISAANTDGSFDVTYYDGFVEFGLRRSMLRLDKGGRYNFVTPIGGGSPYGVFNKYHCARLGLGPRAPPPRKFASVQDALNAAQAGDVIVLRAGLHRSSCCSRDAQAPDPRSEHFTIKKGVRIIGESTLAESRQAQSHIDRLIKGEHDPGGRVGPVMQLKHRKQKESETASVGSKKKRKRDEEKPNPPPPVEMLGLEAIVPDNVMERQHQRVAEEAFCVQDVRVRSPVAGARSAAAASKGEDKKKLVMWSYHQQTALEIDHAAGLRITSETPTDIMILGVAFFHQREEDNAPSAPSATSNGLIVSGKARVWIHNCTVSHLYGSGDAVIVEAQEPGLLCVSDSLICSAPGNGVQVNGAGVVMLNTELCGNGLSAVSLLKGVLLVRRGIMFGNQTAVNLPDSNSKVGVLVQTSDLRGNMSPEPLKLAPGLDKEKCSILVDVLLQEDDEFEVDPWEQAEQRRLAAANASRSKPVAAKKGNQRPVAAFKISPRGPSVAGSKRLSPASQTSTFSASRKRAKNSK